MEECDGFREVPASEIGCVMMPCGWGGRWQGLRVALPHSPCEAEGVWVQGGGVAGFAFFNFFVSHICPIFAL